MNPRRENYNTAQLASGQQYDEKSTSCERLGNLKNSGFSLNSNMNDQQ